MKKRTCCIIGSIITAFCLLAAAEGFPQAVKGATKPGTPARETVKETAPAESTEDLGTLNRYMIFIGGAGGYYVPTGTVGDLLAPNFGGKLIAQYYRSGGYPGIGIEAGAFFLKDQDYDAGIYYTPIIPFGTLTFSLFELMDIQVKVGGGFTVLVSEINTGNSTLRRTSVDFTVDGGLAAIRSIAINYVIGIGMDFYYLFEREESVMFSINIFAGYQF